MRQIMKWQDATCATRLKRCGWFSWRGRPTPYLIPLCSSLPWLLILLNSDIDVTAQCWLFRHDILFLWQTRKEKQAASQCVRVMTTAQRVWCAVCHMFIFLPRWRLQQKNMLHCRCKTLLQLLLSHAPLMLRHFLHLQHWRKRVIAFM